MLYLCIMTEKLTWKCIHNETTGHDEYFTGTEFDASIVKDDEGISWVLSYTDFWTVPDRTIPQLKGFYLTKINHWNVEDLKHYAQYAFEQCNKYCIEKGY